MAPYRSGQRRLPPPNGDSWGLPLALSGSRLRFAGRTPLGGAAMAGPGGRGVVGGVRGGVAVGRAPPRRVRASPNRSAFSERERHEHLPGLSDQWRSEPRLHLQASIGISAMSSALHLAQLAKQAHPDPTVLSQLAQAGAPLPGEARTATSVHE
jgi:hypothetical protein